MAGLKKVFANIQKRPLIFIFVLAIVVRVLLVLAFPTPDQSGGDFPLYQRIADNIVSEGNFGGEPQKTYGSPSISPGWSFFLAGYEILFGKSQAALLAVSILFGALLSIGTYLLALCFFNKRVAMIAGVTTALWPVFLIQTFKYGSSLLLYTVVLLWSVYFLVRSVHDKCWLCAIVSGALLGFAALVDAIALFIPLPFMVWLFIKDRSFRTFGLAALFLIAFALVIAPWAYRNITVAENLGLENAPIISKGELQQIAPDRLLLIAKLVAQKGVLVSGISQIFIFPYDISVLDQRASFDQGSKTSFSYKTKAMHLIRGEPVELSHKELVVLGAKIGITVLHWLLLLLVALTFLMMIRNRQERGLLLLVIFLLLYVTGATIGFGSLGMNDFQDISAPNSFLFPMVPLFLILAAQATFLIGEKYTQKFPRI